MEKLQALQKTLEHDNRCSTLPSMLQTYGQVGQKNRAGRSLWGSSYCSRFAHLGQNSIFRSTATLITQMLMIIEIAQLQNQLLWGSSKEALRRSQAYCAANHQSVLNYLANRMKIQESMKSLKIKVAYLFLSLQPGNREVSEEGGMSCRTHLSRARRD